MKHQRQKRGPTRHHGNVFTKLDKAPNSVRKFTIGQILHVRIYYEDDPTRYKIRPAMFIGSADNRTAIMRAAYSTKPFIGSQQITIGSRTCYISDHPVTVDRTDIVGTTNVIIKPL